MEQLEKLQIEVPHFPEHQVSAADYPDIQSAVNACAAQGGGTVNVPAGKHASKSIHLQSNIRLHLEKGAEIVFSSDPADYLPVVLTRWEGTECYNYSPLIYAVDSENVAVDGEGTLTGNGEAWWHWKKLQQKAAEDLVYAEADGIPVEKRIYGTEKAALRPSFIQVFRCRNVMLEGIRVVNGPQWTLHPVFCENVLIRNVTVRSNGPNTDGLNPDSCRNVLIENCDFSTGDDCIAINAGMNEDGWRAGRCCENVVARNCVMSGGHGGVTIGSAVSGGVRNILFQDCKISGSTMGIRMKSMRGRGGAVENVCFRNITIDQVDVAAIHITMFYQASTVIPRTQTPTEFRNIRISHVSGSGAKTAIVIHGLPELHLQGMVLEHIRLSAQNAAEITDVDGLTINQVELSKSN